MPVISAQNILKSYGEKVVLNSVCLDVERGERIGLVGPNGCGKSTLLRIIAGKMQADSGGVQISQDETIGYLPQVPSFSPVDTVRVWLRNAQQSIRQMEQRMAELADEMAVATGAELERVMQEYGNLSAQFEARNGYDLDFRIQSVLSGLSISHLNEQQLIRNLSGGEKTRLGLAALLIEAPDVLLLDEPTNHLDAEILQWLETYLASYRGSLVVVSHDRQFLNQTVTAIVEVDEYRHDISQYTGNYDAYVEQKTIRRQQWQQKYEAEQEEIAQLKKQLTETARQVGHNRPIKDGNKMAYYGHGQKVQQTISRNVRAAEVKLDRIMANPTPRPPEPMTFSPVLEGEKVHHNVAIAVSELTVTAESGQQLLTDVSFTLGQTEHMLITGPNGAGKTTLLRTIAGQLTPAAGSVWIPQHISIGYIEQELSLDAAPELTLLEYFREGLSGSREEHISTLLSYQLFRFPEFHLPVAGLSPGQQRKLTLAKLMVRRPHLLLIDEPTNHISFDIMEEFEQALRRFNGPVIVVSHDRWFCNHFTGLRRALDRGRLSSPAKSQLTPEDERRMVQDVIELSQYPVDR